jgi:transposase-like protein
MFKTGGTHMSKPRRIYTENFKAKVALEAFRGVKTLSELSTTYNVHPVVIAQWKKQLLDRAPDIFKRSNGSKSDNSDDNTGSLYEEIGRLKVENDWLKKKL